MTTKPIAELHAEHQQWLEKLAFYNDEINIMRTRLEEVVSKNNSKDFEAQAEHFQNQLILQKEKSDELKHSIKDHESYLEKRIDENPTASDHRSTHDHGLMRENMESFEKIFNALRHEFNEFLVKTM
jgi:hypothetical protein